MRGKSYVYTCSHASAVWELSWSHPKYGSLLASCGFDKKINVWKETGAGKWDVIYSYGEHTNSVNCVTFSPFLYGLIMAAGSCDGLISIHSYKHDNWVVDKFLGHGLGVSAISWAPANYSSNEDLIAPMRFASCGMESSIKIWQKEELTGFYTIATLDAHEDSVKTIAWRPGVNQNTDLIATGGNDNVVYLWSSSHSYGEQQNESEVNNVTEWEKIELRTFESPVVKVAWSEDGSQLAVATSEGNDFLFSETEELSFVLTASGNKEGLLEDLGEEN